ALAFDSNWSWWPWELIADVIASSTAPFVPLVSAPLTMVGPQDPRMAMMVQPHFLVLSSVAVAAIASRLAGPLAAIASGVFFASLPTVALATQSYWLGLGATTSVAVAVAALLASGRCSNRWVWVYGVFVGLMLLSRTMT